MHRAPWLTTLLETGRRWLRDRAGNVVVTMTVATPAMIMLIGAGVDYARTQQIQTKFQHSVDTATLAMAKLNAEYDDPQDAAKRFITANLDGEDVDFNSLNITVDITKALNSKKAKITASLDTPLYFAGFFSLDDFNLGATSTAEEVYQHMEISLVLDTSGSMGSKNKIGQLRTAAKDFLDIMLKTDIDSKFTTVNIVPFAGEVNVGDDFAKFITADKQSGWNGCVDFDNIHLDGQVLALKSFGEAPDGLCPDAKRKATFRQNDIAALKSYVDGLSANGYTAADIGAQWGLSALEPEWKPHLPGPVTTAPRDFDGKVAKAMVVMTDGAVNGPWREKKGKWKEVYGSNFAENRFRGLCKSTKKLGIEVYTIGFDVNDKNVLKLLEDCATDAQHYFEPKNGELSDTFKAIAYRLAPLRLVQ